jgi:hypothetical protein
MRVGATARSLRWALVGMKARPASGPEPAYSPSNSRLMTMRCTSEVPS